MATVRYAYAPFLTAPGAAGKVRFGGIGLRRLTQEMRQGAGPWWAADN